MKLTGQFDNGYLYALPKMHKNRKDPPLRPIISMVGTATHSLAQQLNSVILEYLNDTYIIESSNELLLNFDNLKVRDITEFYSLDVESLFTNVPVHELVII